MMYVRLGERLILPGSPQTSLKKAQFIIGSINKSYQMLLHVWTEVRKMSLFNYGSPSCNELQGKLNIWLPIPLSKFKSIFVNVLITRCSLFATCFYSAFVLGDIWFGYLHWKINYNGYNYSGSFPNVLISLFLMLKFTLTTFKMLMLRWPCHPPSSHLECKVIK